jgi:hypothetical protein
LGGPAFLSIDALGYLTNFSSGDTLANSLSDESGTGVPVFSSGSSITNVTLTTPNIGAFASSAGTNSGDLTVGGVLYFSGGGGATIGVTNTLGKLYTAGLTIGDVLTLSGYTGARALFLDAGPNLVTTGTSAYLYNSLLDPDGTGALVFSSAANLTNVNLVTPKDATFTNLTATTLSIGGTNTVLVFNYGGTNYYFALGTNGYMNGGYLKWVGNQLIATNDVSGGSSVYVNAASVTSPNFADGSQIEFDVTDVTNVTASLADPLAIDEMDITTLSVTNLLVYESGGDLLTFAAIDDGEILVRTDTNIVSVALSGTGAVVMSSDATVTNLAFLESGGDLLYLQGAITDGEYLKRDGTNIVSDTPAGAGDMTKAEYDVGDDGVVDIAAALSDGVSLTNIVLVTPADAEFTNLTVSGTATVNALAGAAMTGTSITNANLVTPQDATFTNLTVSGTATVAALAGAGLTGTAITNAVLTTPTDTTFTNVTVATEVYGAGWDSDNTVPTKDAVYDKVQTLGSGTTYDAMQWALQPTVIYRALQPSAASTTLSTFGLGAQSQGTVGSSTLNNIYCLQYVSGAVSNNQAGVYGQYIPFTIGGLETNVMTANFRLRNTNSIRAFAGFVLNSQIVPLQYDTDENYWGGWHFSDAIGDTTWYAVTCHNGTWTRTDTSIAVVPDTLYSLGVQQLGTNSWVFYSGGTAVVTNTSNLPNLTRNDSLPVFGMMSNTLTNAVTNVFVSGQCVTLRNN